MTSEQYAEFLRRKKRVLPKAGFDIRPEDMPDFMFPFQSNVTRWALRNGLAAIFAGTGLGKTAMELAWADAVNRRTKKPVAIFAPLAVGKQTQREGERFGIECPYVRSQQNGSGIFVTNYEMIGNVDPSTLGGIVLDESSIIKSYDGKTRTKLLEFAEGIPLRLAATATPAPNDHEELIQHAEWLGAMSGQEALAVFFTLDGNSTNQWRLKRHAESDWWDFVASWAVAFTHPSQVGKHPDGYDLPPKKTHLHRTKCDMTQTGDLFGGGAMSVIQQRRIRKQTIPDRVAKVAALVANKPDVPWLIWCDLNAESEALVAAINGAVEVRGSDSVDSKESKLADFSEGRSRILVSKPSICGFGMNWQHCADVAFCGMSYSWERYYQAVRRCWRFGQTKPVNVHIVYDEAEQSVIDSIERKQEQADRMMSELASRVMSHRDLESNSNNNEHRAVEVKVPGWIAA